MYAEGFAIHREGKRAVETAMRRYSARMMPVWHFEIALGPGAPEKHSLKR
jgi:hypothetical protein